MGIRMNGRFLGYGQSHTYVETRDDGYAMWQNPSENIMTKNHPSLSREIRSGALAALQALQSAVSMAEEYEDTGNGDETPQEALQAEIEYRARVASSFLEAAGELPPHARGFVAALAEYIDFGVRIGRPDLTTWKPEAAMTAREIERGRAETLADMLAN